MSEEPAVVSLSEAATILGISTKTAQRMAKDGTFPGLIRQKLRGQWRVNRAILMGYINDVGNGDEPTED